MATTYETVMFDADSINDPNYEGVSSGFMSRTDAIEQFRLIAKIMLAHNGMIVECGDNVDGLPYAKFADGSALETFMVF